MCNDAEHFLLDPQVEIEMQGGGEKEEEGEKMGVIFLDLSLKDSYNPSLQCQKKGKKKKLGTDSEAL